MIATNFNAFSRAENQLREMLNSTPEEIAEKDREKRRRKELRATIAIDSKTNFTLFSQLEQQLYAALNPEPAENSMTRTERDRLRRASRIKPKQPQSIYVPEKTTIRFSCLPFSGPAETLEFSYYTPFMDIAEDKARKEIASMGKKYRFVTLLDKDKA